MFFPGYSRNFISRSPCPRGHTTDQLIDLIGKAISDREAVLVACFDDANLHLPGHLLDDILCSFLGIPKKYPKANVGFILMMNDMEVNLSQALDSCFTSDLKPGRINFPLYQKKQMKEILRDGFRPGLNPGVISSKMLSFLVNHIIPAGDMQEGDRAGEMECDGCRTGGPVFRLPNGMLWHHPGYRISDGYPGLMEYERSIHPFRARCYGKYCVISILLRHHPDRCP